jgi:hypothetical protein
MADRSMQSDPMTFYSSIDAGRLEKAPTFLDKGLLRPCHSVCGKRFLRLGDSAYLKLLGRLFCFPLRESGFEQKVEEWKRSFHFLNGIGPLTRMAGPCSVGVSFGSRLPRCAKVKANGIFVDVAADGEIRSRIPEF